MNPMNPIISTLTTDKKLDNEPLVLAFAKQGIQNARDLVVAHYLKFAIAEAFNQFFNEAPDSNSAQLDPAELNEIASKALLKAIDEFDPERGTKFPRFVGQHIRFAGLWALRKKRVEAERIGRAIENDAPCVIANHNIEVAHEADARDCEEIRTRELNKALAATDSLTRQVVEARLEAQSWEDIASALHMPPATVRRRWTIFIKKFQAQFKREYPEYFGVH